MDKISKKIDLLLKDREEDKKMIKLLEENLRNLETQMGQMAQERHVRQQGMLPSDTVANPKKKEQCHAITLRSGKELTIEAPEQAEARRPDKNIERMQAETLGEEKSSKKYQKQPGDNPSTSGE